jgi:hypothetical protein
MLYLITGIILILLSTGCVIFLYRVWNLYDDKWHKSIVFQISVVALFLLVIGINLIIKGL